MEAVEALFRKASDLHRTGRLGEASALYEKILRQSPDHAQALNMRGVLAAQQGDLAGAVEAFTRVVEIEPGGLGGHENLGKALLGFGAPGRAEAAYRKALAVEPESYPSLFGLARALQLQHRLEEAVQVFEAASRVRDSDPVLYLNLGVAQHGLGCLDLAANAFQKALELAPDSLDAAALLAQVLVAQERYEQAARYFEAVLAAGVERVDIELGYAKVLEQRGDEAGARMRYFRAVELDPGSQAAYIELDQFLLKSGGEKKQAFLHKLASDHVYSDWAESMEDFRRLANLYEYPDEESVLALQRFMENYRPGDLHDRSWWQGQLEAFGGEGHVHDRLLRSLHSAVYCWSLPDRQTLSDIAGFVGQGRLCSYGAGSGVWECLLQQHFGIDVMASDLNLRHRFIPMIRQDYAHVRVLPDDIIFLSWIVRGDQGVMNVLGQMCAGQKLVLIGEPRDAQGVPRICGTPEMWALLDSAFERVEEIPLVSYSLLNDTVSLFVKK